MIKLCLKVTQRYLFLQKTHQQNEKNPPQMWRVFQNINKRV